MGIFNRKGGSSSSGDGGSEQLGNDWAAKHERAGSEAQEYRDRPIDSTLTTQDTRKARGGALEDPFE